MKPELEPLDADVLALLAGEKPVADLPAPARDAIFATIEAKLGMPPAPGSDGSGGSEGSSGGAGPAAPVGPSVSAATAGLSGVRALAALATTFAIGVGTGVVMDRNLSEPSPVRTTVTTVAPSAASVAQPVGVPATADPPALAFSALPPFITPSAAPTKLDPPAPIPSSRGLAAERGLLDVARGALARGEAGAALAATERHSREYPAGVLLEEREAIAIKALVALGRKDEAQTRAKAFEQRFPNGLMLRAVRGAVGAP